MPDFVHQKTFPYDPSMVTAVVADGEFPQRSDHLKLISQAGFVAACDGAAVSLLNFGREPDVVVGDLDSLPCGVRTRLAGRLDPVREQESNDLSKALHWVAAHRPAARVAVLGAAGKREDHLLGNLAVFAACAALFDAPPVLLTENGIFTVLKQSGSVACVPGQQISIFSFDPACEITSSALKYPLQKRRLRWWFEATLNEALSDSFSLEFTGDRPLLLFLVDPARRGRQFTGKEGV